MQELSVKEQCDFRVMVRSSALKSPISNRLIQSVQMTSSKVLNEITKALQSNEEIPLDQSFTIGITGVKAPTGSRKSLKVLDHTKDPRLKKSVITIKNRDTLCCRRALAVSTCFTPICYHGEQCLTRKVKKERINHGRLFYVCSKGSEESCVYFEWRDTKRNEDPFDPICKVNFSRPPSYVYTVKKTGDNLAHTANSAHKRGTQNISASCHLEVKFISLITFSPYHCKTQCLIAIPTTATICHSYIEVQRIV